MKKRYFLIGAALGAAVTAVAAEELYRFVFVRGGSPVLSPLFDSRTHAEDYYAHRDGKAAALREMAHERLTLRSGRGELLQGYYIPCGGSGGKKLAFLVHGYHSEYAENAGMYVDYYASRGFDVFSCDNTAHGESEGWFIGFDVFESEDCLRWLDRLIKRFGPDTQIVLHGFSLGAATVLRMSDRCPDNVKCIVEDSGFVDARHAIGRQLGALYGPMRGLHRLVSGCDLGEADVRPHLDRATLPILFVHGMDDPTVPFENGTELYAYYQGPKDCLFLPGVKHVETMHVAPDAYQAKLDAFLAGCIR